MMSDERSEGDAPRILQPPAGRGPGAFGASTDSGVGASPAGRRPGGGGVRVFPFRPGGAAAQDPGSGTPGGEVAEGGGGKAIGAHRFRAAATALLAPVY